MSKKNGYQDFFKKAQKVQLRQNMSYFKRFKTLEWKKMSSKAALGLGVCMAVAALGFTLYDEGEWINKAFDKVEIGFLGKATAAEKAAKKMKSDKAKSKASKDAAKDAANKGNKDASRDIASVDPQATKKTWTDEEIALFNKLEDRKGQLDAREAELQKLEAELQKEKEDLEKRLAQLEDVRKKIATRLDEKVKVDQQKVESLVAVYQNMKPQQAAKIFEDMNEDLAVEVLAKMKNKAAAEILNMVKSDKAKRLSERYAGYKED